jgi:hypothetical protein
LVQETKASRAAIPGPVGKNPVTSARRHAGQPGRQRSRPAAPPRRQCGRHAFADPESYQVIDKVTFDLLAEKKEERAYFVDPDGRASQMRDHDSIRPIRGQRHDYGRLFVPEEAIGGGANLIK